MKKHLVIPDCQVTPTTPTDHLEWIGHYIIEQKADVVVQLGDFADMESLSSYDAGKRAHEGRRYIKDVQAARLAMERLLSPLNEYNAKRRLYKEKTYHPAMHLTIGNHEFRSERAVECDAKLEGCIGISDLGYKEAGWTVHDYLCPVEIDGVSYCHFFANPLTGKPYGGSNIDLLLKNIGHTFTMGHRQVLQTGLRSLDNGKRLRGIVCGTCYLHDEDFRGKQGNVEWRGLFVKHEVADGNYDLMEVSLDFLCRKYEGVRLWKFMQKKYPDIFNNSATLQRQRQQENV